MAKPRMTMEVLKEINKLYDKGTIMKDLADKYNLSIFTIHRYIWKPRAKGRKPYINKEIATKINDMFKNKFTVNEIVKEVGVRQRLIYSYLEKQRDIGGKL